MFATQTEIQYAEKLLLPKGQSFSDKRKEIILNNESADFHACPGSGKTTTLLAKIIILANRMPLSDGKGICVLTHTNVAIDEIKARLGEKANILFSYPNFFGTLQTFVHKYFATQALQHYYNSPINRVDDAYAAKHFVQLCKQYGRQFTNKKDNIIGKMAFVRSYAAHATLAASTIQTFGETKVLTKLKVISASNKFSYIINREKLSSSLTETQIDAIFAKRNEIMKTARGEVSDIIGSCEFDWLNRKITLKYGTPLSMDSPSGQELVKLKDQQLRKGILTFNDAYQLALRYISETDIPFKQFISNRFAYLFIDEMQDIDATQKCLIDKIFDKKQVIVQSFGDSDQAIFQENTTTITHADNSIDDSCRFGDSIAKVLQTICVRPYSELSGNSEIKSLKPIMLVYKEPQKVLPEFAKLLTQTKLSTNESVADFAKRKRQADALHRINIKAIGFRSDTDSEENNKAPLSINSYFPSFEKKSSRTYRSIKTLENYIHPIANASIKDYTANIVDAILAFLDVVNIKNQDKPYSKTSLFAYLHNLATPQDNELKSKIAYWIMQIENKQQTVLSEIQSYLTDEFLTYFGITTLPTTSEYQEFMSNTQNNTTPDAMNSCIYTDEAGIDIEVATVHSVKGETHIATLYLDTSYHSQTESTRFKENIEGSTCAKNGQQNAQVSRVMYVGMSRPKYLLCYAVSKDIYVQFDHEKIKALWDIVEIE